MKFEIILCFSSLILSIFAAKGHRTLNQICDIKKDDCDEGYVCTQQNIVMYEPAQEIVKLEILYKTSGFPVGKTVCKKKPGRKCTKHSDCQSDHYCHFSFKELDLEYICTPINGATQFELGLENAEDILHQKQ
jgi:hypothetical protein